MTKKLNELNELQREFDELGDKYLQLAKKLNESLDEVKQFLILNQDLG